MQKLVFRIKILSKAIVEMKLFCFVVLVFAVLHLNLDEGKRVVVVVVVELHDGDGG